MSTAIANVNNDGATLMAIIQQAASQPDLDVAKMQQLMELKRDWDRDRAAESYAAALTSFQAKCPVVGKHRTANVTSKTGGSYKYKFAGYEDVMKQVKPLLNENKIAVSFSTDDTPKGILATCTLRVGTHSESHTLTLPIPAMNVNDAQKYGAALSYAKRYALCAALNIVVGDEDDDAGTLNPPETITDDDAIQLSELIEAKGVDKKRFLDWAEVDSLSKLPKSRHQQALDFLNRK